MKDAIITKSGVNYSSIANEWSLGTIAAGELAAFDQDGVLLDAAAPDVSTSDYISFALGTVEGEPKRLRQVYKEGFTSVKQAYVAPVAAVKFIGSDAAAAAGSYSLNLPSSIAIGDEFGVDIIDLEKPHYETNRIKSYSVVAKTGDLLTGNTAKNIIARIIALVNADEARTATALKQEDGSNNIDGIKFTGVTAGFDFAVVPTGKLQDADFVENKRVNNVYDASSTTAVAPNPGFGTYAQVKYLEDDFAAIKEGKHGQFEEEYNVTSKVVPGVTYVVYTVSWKIPKLREVQQEDTLKPEIHFCVPSGETGAGEVITVLDLIFAAMKA